MNRVQRARFIIIRDLCMLRIISADKFISSRFILEYSKVEFASLLGVSVAKITNIESGKSSIPPVYDYAINYLLSEHPFISVAIAAGCTSWQAWVGCTLLNVWTASIRCTHRVSLWNGIYSGRTMALSWIVIYLTDLVSFPYNKWKAISRNVDGFFVCGL